MIILMTPNYHRPHFHFFMADVRIIKSNITSEYIVDIKSIPIKSHPDYFRYGKLKNLQRLLLNASIKMKRCLLLS
jgi:hypothetical protein